MSLMIQDEYIFQFPVDVKVPTLSQEPQTPNQNTHSFMVTARAVSELTIQEWIKDVPAKDIDTTLCEKLITSWEQVVDANQNPIPFTKENCRNVVAFPFIRNAILSSYWTALYESRLKN